MPIESRSVLDPRRIENNQSHDSVGSYTYTKRETRRKVEFSLGWELEANHAAARIPNGVERISDGSVDGDEAEYIVLPSVVRSARFSLGLLKELVHAPELNTNKSCGFHIHLSPKGASVPTMRKWALMCQLLAQRVERLAFLAVPDARQGNNYCRPVRLLEHGTRFAGSKYGNDFRYQWLNIVEMFRPGGIRTVEVRLLGNTHRWKYLLAWSLFCLMLGREAWHLIHEPLALLEVDKSVALLEEVLQHIIDEVKPLERRAEPIPSWVYKGLERLGVDHSKWNRPLSKLVDAECETLGRRKMFYSDAQATIENDSRSDDECPCGCGVDGRCDSQIHDDGDCDSSECIACHENDNCGGSPDCMYCRDARHSEREYCGGSYCNRCRERGLVPGYQRQPSESVAHTEAIAVNNIHDATARVQRVFFDEAVNVGSGVDNAANYAPVTATEASGTFTGVFHPSNAVALNPNWPITDDEATESIERELRNYTVNAW